jgi:hypothetical protein
MIAKTDSHSTQLRHGVKDIASISRSINIRAPCPAWAAAKREAEYWPDEVFFLEHSVPCLHPSMVLPARAAP